MEDKYDKMLKNYLQDGINWDAYNNEVIKTANKNEMARGDVEQFAADSYWQGWQDAKSEDGKLPIPHVSGSLPDKEIRNFRTSNDITEDEMIEREAAKYWQHSSDIQSKWFEKGAKWMRDLLRQ